MKDIANNLGIELNYDTGSRKIIISQGKKLKKTHLCNFVLNADKIIALPKIKTHSFMIMTLAIKNMYGVIPGLTKARYHSMFIKKTAFADMLLDVLSVRKPDLVIMDGIIGMEGDGPSGGTPVHLGVLLASDDAVAMDLTVCTMLGIEPVGIPILRQANIENTCGALASLVAAGKPVDLYLFPVTDHGMFEYRTLPDGSREVTRITEGYLRLVGDWIKADATGRYGRGTRLFGSGK